MNLQKQLKMFGKECWGPEHDITWQVLERHGGDLDTQEVIDHLEMYMGKLPANMIFIPTQVFYVPGSNLFLMPILAEEEEEIEEIQDVEVVE